MRGKRKTPCRLYVFFTPSFFSPSSPLNPKKFPYRSLRISPTVEKRAATERRGRGKKGGQKKGESRKRKEKINDERVCDHEKKRWYLIVVVRLCDVMGWWG